MIKLIYRFFKYLYPPSNPLPGKRLFYFFVIVLFLIIAFFSYSACFVEEQVEFISFSPAPIMPGKLYSLAYFSAVSGDIELGKYFYDLSLSYGMDEVKSDDKLIQIIYPERKLEEEKEKIVKLLTYYPTSRDLHILRALVSYELGNFEDFSDSVDSLRLIDPNNPQVLGLEDIW